MFALATGLHTICFRAVVIIVVEALPRSPTLKALGSSQKTMNETGKRANPQQQRG